MWNTKELSVWKAERGVQFDWWWISPLITNNSIHTLQVTSGSKYWFDSVPPFFSESEQIWEQVF